MIDKRMNARRIPVLFCLVLIFGFLTVSCKERGITTEVIDGVKHIHNPAEPLKGTIDLEVEEVLRIDPAELDIEDFVVFSDFWKDPSGNVFLYDNKTIKAYQFSKKGQYLGTFLRRGQGPGEFPQYTGVYISFVRNDEIWVKGGLRIDRFDTERNFISEEKLRDYYSPIVFIDEDRFVGQHRENIEEDGEMQPWTIVSYIERSQGDKEKILSDYFKAKNLGIIRVGKSAFAETWATPRVKWIYDSHKGRVYTALNTEYKINVHALKGGKLFVLDKAYNPIGLSTADKKVLIEKVFERVDDWILKAYPDHLCAIKEIQLLPNGHVAVYSISGILTYTVDIYNSEGEFTWVLNPPQGLSLEGAQFSNFGFAVKEEKEDRDVYVEYRIKNLPEIFEDR